MMKNYRKFLRHLRASDMKPFLKTGCDMGWYGHFTKPVKIDKKKINKVKKIMKKKKNNYWFTADEHYYHKNINRFAGRPFDSVEEMNQQFIDNHNEVVGRDDITVHAGDFSFASYTNTKEIIRQLNGNHVFLKGDHDRWIGNKYYADIWKKTINGISICVSHYAMRVWWLSHYNSWNLFGHSHGRLDGIGKQIDIGVDNFNYYPVPLDKLKKIMYDKDNNFNYIKRRE